LLSVAGDQLARVALTILVYDRTHSAFLAAVTFVTSVVPTFIGGVTLARLADRFPRRTVMIACDLARCALVALMVVPGVPLAVLVVLLFVVTLVGAPFTAARAAVYPDVLAGDRYVVGTAVTLTTNQLAQVVGFAAGGAIVGFFGTRTSLVVDAVTFAGSATVIRAFVRRRPVPGPVGGASPGSRHRPMETVRLVFGTAALRTPMLFGWLMAFYDAPEGVSAPLAHRLGGGALTLGMLLSAQTLGVSIGALVFGRAVALYWQRRVLGVLATATCATLVLFAFTPPLAGSMLILGVSGALSCYQLTANTTFVQATPDEHRGSAFGLAQGGISLGQGVMMLLAGAAAQRISPDTAIAACGALGTVAAVALAASPSGAHRHRSPQELPQLPGPATGAHGDASFP
jgi:MFS family permease